jgi:hypothetical protein
VAWYWWVIIVVGALIVLSAIFDRKKPAEEPMAIVIGSARREPTLTPELEAYVSALVAIHRSGRDMRCAEARQIGEEIHEKHGHRAMVDVCDTLRNRAGYEPYRTLEYCWNGIGQWQS